MIRSLRPSPYTSAVSRNVVPVAAAVSSTASASFSATSPQSAPSCHVPSPTTETARPVLPRMRFSIGAECSEDAAPTARMARPGRLAWAGSYAAGQPSASLGEVAALARIAALIPSSCWICSALSASNRTRRTCSTWPGAACAERGEALVGEHGDLAAAVGRAVHPADPAAFLQPGHRVRHAALAGRGRLGELRHPQRAVRRLGQPDQDLVVGERHPGIALQLGVNGGEEPLPGLDRLPPGVLLVGAQPARSRIVHGNSIPGIVERLTTLDWAWYSLRVQI